MVNQVHSKTTYIQSNLVVDTTYIIWQSGIHFAPSGNLACNAQPDNLKWKVEDMLSLNTIELNFVFVLFEKKHV